MTEDEAKTRWCPMALIGTGQALAVNRGNKDYPITACVGSACMMWRSDNYLAREPEGYCGLAGRP